MAIIFKPAVPTSGSLMIIQTYHNQEQCETDYKPWRNFADSKGIIKPVPIQRIEEDKWKILENLISLYSSYN